MDKSTTELWKNRFINSFFQLFTTRRQSFGKRFRRPVPVAKDKKRIGKAKIMCSACPTVRFSKTIICPSAQMLLGFRAGSLTCADRERVAAHLCACEFCSAESQLLARHANLNDKADDYNFAECYIEIPPSLRRLAEDIFARNHSLMSVSLS